MIKFILENFDTIFKNENSLETLNKIILDLAIRGKLVPQNENDEPAGELLKRIQAEKERLIKEKIIKKEKPLPEITEDEIPFDIPKNWEWVRLKEVVQIINGVAFEKKVVKEEVFSNSILVIRGGNIQKNKLITFMDTIYIPEELVKKEQLIKQGDTLMVSSSGTLTSVGKSVYIEKEEKNMTIGAFLLILRAMFNESSKFLHYYFKIMREKIISDLKGTSISNIKKSVIENYLVPLPPLEEQKRIVEKVENLMEICNLLEEKINISENISENLLKSFINNGEQKIL